METDLFEELGGHEAIVAAVDIFYQKVLSDPRLSNYFTDLSMDQQTQKMVSFMAWAFGGPDEYKGRDLRSAHKSLVRSKGLNNSHFDLIATHLTATLKELDVEQRLIDRVLSIVSGTRDEVLDR